MVSLALFASNSVRAQDSNIGQAVVDDIQDDSIGALAVGAGVGALAYLLVVQARKKSEKKNEVAAQFEERSPEHYLALSERKKRTLFRAIAYQELEPKKFSLNSTAQGLSITF